MKNNPKKLTKFNTKWLNWIYWLGEDKNLIKLSHISQIVVAIIVVIGYFCTVKPIYRLDVLEEQIAKKEVEYNLVKNETDQLIRQNALSAGATIRNIKSQIYYCAWWVSLGNENVAYSGGLDRGFKCINDVMRETTYSLFITIPSKDRKKIKTEIAALEKRVWEYNDSRQIEKKKNEKLILNATESLGDSSVTTIELKEELLEKNKQIDREIFNYFIDELSPYNQNSLMAH